MFKNKRKMYLQSDRCYLPRLLLFAYLLVLAIAIPSSLDLTKTGKVKLVIHGKSLVSYPPFS